MNRLLRIFSAAAILAVVIFTIPTQAVQANGAIVVNTLGDTVVNDSFCGLREAITAANTNAAYNGCSAGIGNDLITFGVSGTILLTSSLPTITGDLTIDGGNAITLDGQDLYQMLKHSASYLELRNLVITNGTKGVVSTGGTLVLDTVTLSNFNSAGDMAIHNSATPLTVRNCILSGNGYGVYSMSPDAILIDNTTFNSNTNYAMQVAATSTIVLNSTFSDNSGNKTLFAIGNLEVSNSIFRNNHLTSNGGSGGAIVGNSCSVTIRDSLFEGNSITGSNVWGGAISVGGTAPSLTITGSTFDGNTANNTGSTGAMGGGGAIFINSGPLTVSTSTLINNTAISANPVFPPEGGAIHAGLGEASAVTLTNVTLATNTAKYGAAIHLDNGTLTINNSTILHNIAAGGGMDSAINAIGISGTINNTIIGATVAGSSCQAASLTISNTYSTDSSCPGSTTVTEPALLMGPFGDYGGSVDTYALLPGSPAIQAGNNATCAATDARGVVRPQLTACDLGAFESRGFTLGRLDGHNQSALINQPFPTALLVSVISVYDEPVNGGVVTFTAPVSGASITTPLATAPIVPNAKGVGSSASLSVIANDTLGSYTVSADTRGQLSGVHFTLTNTQLLLFLPLISR
jgi:CSLREA domain-containing protein